MRCLDDSVEIGTELHEVFENLNKRKNGSQRMNNMFTLLKRHLRACDLESKRPKDEWGALLNSDVSEHYCVAREVCETTKCKLLAGASKAELIA